MFDVRVRGLFAALLITFLISACQPAGGTDPAADSNASADSKNTEPTTKTISRQPDKDGFIPSGTGTEKETPAAGTGNVQGKVMFNEQPAVGIEVKLCEKFARFGSGCGGEVYTTKTDSQGEYLIKGVAPGPYEALTAKVFDTNYFVFATSGYVASAKYRIDDGKTYFAPDTHLFKDDLKVTAPKAGSKVPADAAEVTWEAYPDAAYYKLSLHGTPSDPADYDNISKRVDGTSYSPPKPLKAAEYRIRLEAFNANDVKLAEAPADHKFTVAGN